MHTAAAQTLLPDKEFKMKVSRFRGVAGQSELVFMLLLVPAAVVLFGCASPQSSVRLGVGKAASQRLRKPLSIRSEAETGQSVEVGWALRA